jgi:hypothetical protein
MAKRFHGKGDGAFRLQGKESDIALMPSEMIVRRVGEPYSSLPSDYPDTVSGVDSQIMFDTNTMRRAYKPGKV